MQNRNSLLSLNRTNYVPNEDEKDLVHYKVEKPKYDSASGERISHPELIMTPPKLFDSVKRELELQGHVVEVLYHPDGKYNTPITPNNAVDSLARQKDALEQRIAELEARAAAAEKRASEAEKRVDEMEESMEAVNLDEAPTEAENSAEAAAETVAETKTKKAGRPAKK